MTAKRDSVRKWLATLAVSLLLHALVLTAWCGAPDVAAPPQTARSDAVSVELVFEPEGAKEPEAVPALETPAEPETPAPGKDRRRSQPRGSPERRSESATASKSESEPEVAASSADGIRSADSSADTPVRGPGAPLVLLPSQRAADAITGGAASGEGGGAPSGRTIVNGPGEVPDEAAVAEYTSEKLSRELGAELRRDVGEGRVRANTQPRYYVRVQRLLRDELGRTPVTLTGPRSDDVSRSSVADAIETWRGPAQQFGRTGSPATSPEQTRAVESSSFGRMMDRGAHPSRDENIARDMNGAMQSMVSIDILRESSRRPRLRVVVSMYQEWSGALADIRLIERSGDEGFDEFVLHISRKVLREKGERDHDDADLPYRSDGWSSEWQFTWEPPQVRVELLRVMPGPPPATSRRR